MKAYDQLGKPEVVRDRVGDLWLCADVTGLYEVPGTQSGLLTLDKVIEQYGPVELPTWKPAPGPCPHADVKHSTEWCGCTCPET